MDFSRHEIVICLILVTVILIIGVFPTLIQDLLGNSYERSFLNNGQYNNKSFTRNSCSTNFDFATNKFHSRSER